MAGILVDLGSRIKFGPSFVSSPIVYYQMADVYLYLVGAL